MKGLHVKVKEQKPTTKRKVQQLIDELADVFQYLPHELPLKMGHEHIIELEPGSKLVIVPPYMYPKLFKDKIERIVKKLLDLGHIVPSKSPFASPLELLDMGHIVPSKSSFASPLELIRK